MHTLDFDQKRSDFKSLLFELAKSQDILASAAKKSNVYIKLEQIYYSSSPDEEFRHYYSDIFSVISQIAQDSTLGNIDVLSQNMDIIRKGYRPSNLNEDTGETIDVSMQIHKLYDHVNLDIARLNYASRGETQTKNELHKVNDTLEKVNVKIGTMQSTIDKADDMQKQYITILGIFASIVLAFTGGIAFSTSVLQNISNVSIYRLTMIVICLACVLMNVIYLLVWFIKGLIKKEGDIVQYPKFMKVFNLSCLIAIMLTIVAWWFDLKYLAKIFRIWLYKI